MVTTQIPLDKTVSQAHYNRMKPRRAPDGWTVVRVALFLQGAAVLGVLLAWVCRGFIGAHPILSVFVAGAYAALCAVGAYSKYAQHTAALALVGWYLMVPPASDWKRFQDAEEVTGYYARLGPFYPAPFDKWKKLGEFYSQANCESTRQFIRRRDGPITGQPLLANGSAPNAKQYQANEATCIAADDPRLKEK